METPRHYERIEKRGLPIGQPDIPEPCTRCKDKGWRMQNGNYGFVKVYCDCPAAERLKVNDPL